MEQHLLTCDRCGKTEKRDTLSLPSSGLSLATPPLPARVAGSGPAAGVPLHVNFCGACVEAFAAFAPNLDRSWKHGLGRYTEHPHVVVFDTEVTILPTQSAQINEYMINLPFRPERFEFFVDDLDAWTVHDFLIGHQTQVRYRPAIPRRDLSIPLALLVDPDRVNELLVPYATCQPGMSMVLVVTYLGKDPEGQKFLGNLHGKLGGFAQLADVEEHGTPLAVEVDGALKRWQTVVASRSQPEGGLSQQAAAPQPSTAS
jgi:hypothetical protein